MNLKMFYLIKKLLGIRFRAKNHKIGTYEIDNISLSCVDDKRFIEWNLLNSHPGLFS